MLPTIEISSIIIAFSSHSDNLICVLFWSDIADRTSPVLLGIANAVLMIVPAIFIAATPVDAASPGGYFRNFWVGMCRWDLGTLNLYQS